MLTVHKPHQQLRNSQTKNPNMTAIKSTNKLILQQNIYH